MQISAMHNDRLPLDVLEEIFLFYQVHEDVFYPLEMLLLVCKVWSMAALGCRSLWSNFKIHISHEPIIKM
jgi:F-box-like